VKNSGKKPKTKNLQTQQTPLMVHVGLVLHPDFLKEPGNDKT
jgi:hypothetical protein